MQWQKGKKEVASVYFSVLSETDLQYETVSAKMIGTVDFMTYWLVHIDCWTLLLCEQSAGKSMIQANIFQK